MLRRTLPALVLLSCATPPTQKITFEEAMGWSESQLRVQSIAPDDPLASQQVAQALETFIAESQREPGVPKGAPMPDARITQWSRFLSVVDVFVQLPGGRVSLLDSMRMQLRVEDAVNTDGQRYGDIPETLIARIQQAQKALSRQRAMAFGVRKHGAFIWPLPSVMVTSPFGERVHPIRGESSFHKGVDLAASTGQPVVAAADGFVEYAGPHGGHGNHIQIRHSKIAVTRYSHLQEIVIESGIMVHQGDTIGLAGSTGHSTGPHLHFQLSLNDEDVDPLPYMPHIRTPVVSPE